MIHRLLRCLAVLLLTTAFAELSPATTFAQPNRGADQRPPGVPAPGSTGQPPVVFERTSLDFLTQGINQENCANIPLSNKGDGPRTMTILRSSDPVHFRVNSPVQEMMPMLLEPHSSVFINVCFKADRQKEYKATLLAVVDNDTVTIPLTGKGIKQPKATPVPTQTALHAIKGKGRIPRTFAIDVPTRSSITLEVEDILGNGVRKLLTSDLKSPGIYEVEFDWTDAKSQPLPAGTYFFRLEESSVESHAVTHASLQVKLKP